jgi:hypothetical protein
VYHTKEPARLANQYMSGTDQLLIIAEDSACSPNSNFSIAYSKCENCLTIFATNLKTASGAVLNSLDICKNSSAFASFKSSLSLEFSAAVSRESLCILDSITSDCLTTSGGNVTVATISSKPAAVSTLVVTSSAAANYSVASTSPLKSAGAIAGVAVACTLAVVLIIALVIFLCFRRHKRHKQDKIRKAEIASRQEDKAQLHSEDLKPIRKELSGDQPLASKKDVPIAEMPANEDPQRTTGEMPANEVVGTELQGESNEERDEENRSSQSN